MKPNTLNKCEFCDKQFKSERTLFAHTCRLKIREQSRSDPETKLALLAYQRFYQLTQGSPNIKTWEQFSNSSYYAGFVRFARYVKTNNVINPMLFVDWVIKKQVKLTNWCSDRVYEEYLVDLLTKESAEAAVERGFLAMQEWADKFDTSFNQYFYHAGNHRLVRDISLGSISPWLLYATETGRDALDKLDESQIAYVIKYIEPDVWQNKIRNDVEELEYVRNACEVAGIK